MSALTDLFTALANKIRSKTGGSDTYTPLEMVSDGIDDVYAAGEAAGTTTHTQTYTPSADTAANDMGVEHEYRYVNTSGMITPTGNKAITANGTGIDVSSYATASVAVPDPTLDGDAAVGNVLSGKTFYNNSTTKRTGSMTNNGAVSQALNCGGSYTVPEGYHNGSGTVTANSLASQTGVDSGKTAIDASHVHSGYQGWVNGSKVSGSYTAPTIQPITPSNSSPVSISSGNNYTPSESGQVVKNVTNTIVSSGAPTSLSKDNIYKFSTNIYASQSYNGQINPNTSGVEFYNGLNYMGNDGFAYSQRPTGGFSETTLWTNSSPTSSFAAQDITLSQSFTNFDYIKINWRATKSNTTAASMIVPPSVVQNSSATANSNNVEFGTHTGSTVRARSIRYSSNTKLSISAAYNVNASGSSTEYAIPTSIVGLKFTP